MNFKKYISLVIVCALATGTTVAFAEGDYSNANSIETSVVVANIAEKLEVLTLEQVVDMAVENNRSYKLFENKVTIAESYKRRADASVEYYKNEANWKTTSERLSNAYGAYVTPIQKQNALNEVLRDQESELIDLKNNVKEQYFDILIKLDQITSKKADIKYFEDQLRNKESELSVGKITEQDLTLVKVNLKNAELDLKKLEAGLDAAYMTINITLNQPMDYRFELKEVKFMDEPFLVENLEEQIEFIKENDDNVLSSQETLVALKEEIQVVRVYTVTNNYNENVSNAEKILDLNESIENTENSMITNTINAEYNLLKTYNELQNSFDNIEIANLNYQLSIKDAEIAKIKYDAGLINTLDYRRMVQTRDDQKVAYTSSQMDYFLAVEKFKADFY